MLFSESSDSDQSIDANEIESFSVTTDISTFLNKSLETTSYEPEIERTPASKNKNTNKRKRTKKSKKSNKKQKAESILFVDHVYKDIISYSQQQLKSSEVM